MKRVLLMIASLFLVFNLTGCNNTKYTEYQRVSYSELQEMINNKETFPLVIGSATCSACASYEVTMKTFIPKYNIKVYFIDINELSQEEKVKINSEINYSSTPTTVVFKDGNVTMSYDRLVGAASLKDVESFFKKHGFIK